MLMKQLTGGTVGGGGSCDVLIPNMTSATAPSGSVSGDAGISGYEAYKAFNNESANGWYINNAAYANKYIQYEFGSAVTARATVVYVIQGSGTPTVTYTLKGSNDGSTWDSLVTDATANNNASDYWTNVQEIGTPKAYKYYRWEFSASTTTTAAKGLKINLLG